jgi:hypothetical protein
MLERDPKFRSEIIAGDEIWVDGYDVETKQQFLVVESIMSVSRRGKTSLLKCEEQAHCLFDIHRDVCYEIVLRG